MKLCLVSKKMNYHVLSSYVWQFHSQSRWRIDLSNFLDDSDSYAWYNAYMKARNAIPRLLEKFVIYVEHPKNIEEESIYRTSGSLKDLKELKKLYKQGKMNLSQLNFDTYGSWVIASFVKTYLRSLPQMKEIQLILAIIFDETTLQEFARIESLKQQVTELKRLLQYKQPDTTAGSVQPIPCLQQKHRIFLCYLCRHLSTVASHCALNLMSARNLAIIFATVLFDDSDFGEGIEQYLQQMNLHSAVVRLMIEFHEEIFAGKPITITAEQEAAAAAATRNNNNDDNKCNNAIYSSNHLRVVGWSLIPPSPPALPVVPPPPPPTTADNNQ
eukprot:GEZU01025807.1.p1 GENE.GEZU01025807.1~~GEZU01025807.1.p1  ORF type:complete len:328 (-),score=105.82 GEZU01025807.1:797-1780(-)